MNHERLIQLFKDYEFIITEYWSNINKENIKLLDMLEVAKRRTFNTIEIILNTYYKFIPNYYREKLLDVLWYSKSSASLKLIREDLLSFIDTPKEAVEILE